MLAAVALLGWLATAFGWWISRRGDASTRARTYASESATAQNQRAALAAVKRACKTGDAALTTEAVRSWAGQYDGLSPSLHGLATAAQSAGNEGLADNLVALERQRYASGSTIQQAADLDALPKQLQDFGKELSRAGRLAARASNGSALRSANALGGTVAGAAGGGSARIAPTVPALGPDHAKGELPEL